MILVERKCPRARLLLERHKAAWQGRAILRNQGIRLFCSVPKASYVALTRKVIGVITTRRCCDRIRSLPGCGSLKRKLRINSARVLSTACLFDGPNDNSFRFFPREIRDGQVGDGLSLTGLFVRIDGNLSNLYCYPRRAAVNNRNILFFFVGQGITSQA